MKRRQPEPKPTQKVGLEMVRGWNGSKLAVRVWEELVWLKGERRKPDQIEIATYASRPVEEWHAVPTALVIELHELPHMIKVLQAIQTEIQREYGAEVFAATGR